MARRPRSTSTSVSLDEGGARVVDEGERRYYPFDRGLRATLKGARPPALTIRSKDLRVRAHLGDPDSVQAALLIRDRIRARAAQDPIAVDECLTNAIGRRGRSLRKWCAALDRYVATMQVENSYRESGAVSTTLRDTFLEPKNPIELRAAAAFACLRQDPDDARVLSACSDATPPLVAALLALAAPSSPELLSTARAASGFLDSNDARALEALLGRGRAGRARVAPTPSDIDADLDAERCDEHRVENARDG